MYISVPTSPCGNQNRHCAVQLMYVAAAEQGTNSGKQDGDIDCKLNADTVLCDIFYAAVFQSFLCSEKENYFNSEAHARYLNDIMHALLV